MRVRIPTIRFRGDARPIAWWEWFFYPAVMLAVIPLFVLAAFLSVPYFAIYPDHHAQAYDFGTERQREIMRRYRRYTARVPFWRGCLRVVAFPFRRKRVG